RSSLLLTQLRRALCSRRISSPFAKCHRAAHSCSIGSRKEWSDWDWQSANAKMQTMRRNFAEGCTMKATHLLGVFAAGIATAKAPNIPNCIDAPHRAALAVWLSTHEQYRLADVSDCQCDQE